jgi:hypothetical protein
MAVAVFQMIQVTFIGANSSTIREDHMEYSSMLTERNTQGNTCREADTVMEYSNGQAEQKAKDN